MHLNMVSFEGFAGSSTPLQTYIYNNYIMYIQNLKIEHNYLPQANELGNYILNDYNIHYKLCFLQLKLLPLMYLFDFNDILFFIKSYKYPSPDT